MGIRRAGPFDLDLLVAMHSRCFEDEWNREAYARLLAGFGTTGLLSLAADARPCGFGLVRTIAGEAEVLTLGVLPECRGHGHGRALIDAMAAAASAAGAAHLFLEVADDNTAARALYQRTGFTPIARRICYYRTSKGSTDALVLRLDLTLRHTD